MNTTKKIKNSTWTGIERQIQKRSTKDGKTFYRVTHKGQSYKAHNIDYARRLKKVLNTLTVGELIVFSFEVTELLTKLVNKPMKGGTA